MKNYHYIAFLRILAMFAIIGAHTVATPVIYNAQEYSDFWLHLSVVLTMLQRGGVNIFIAISGALFLQPEKELTLSKLFKKYIFRIVLALLIFGTLFALMEIVFTEKSFHAGQILTALLNMLQNKSWGHLWYLYMLAGLYLVTPVFKRFVNSVSNTEIRYLLLVLVVFDMLFPLLENFTGVKIGFYIPFAGMPVFYYLLGYALHAKIVRLPDIPCFGMILLSLAIYLAECLIPVEIDTISVQFKGLSMTALLSSFVPVAIFSLALNHCKTEIGAKRTNCEKLLSELSFGVYIFHAVFINFIYKVLHLSPANLNVFLMWVIVFVITSILSLLTTYILRLIPLVRKYIL